MNRLPIKKINKKIRNNSTVPNFQKNRPQLNAFIQIPELQCTKKQNIIKKINNKIQKSAMVPKMKRTYTTGSQHLSIKKPLDLTNTVFKTKFVNTAWKVVREYFDLKPATYFVDPAIPKNN